MKWYKLYLKAQCYGDFEPATTKPTSLRELLVNALARRDAAANLLRSRDDFYAELKRLSAASSSSTMTICSVEHGHCVETIVTLRKLAVAKLVPLSADLKACKDIIDQVFAGKPFDFKVKTKHRSEVIAKLRGAGATVE